MIRNKTIRVDDGHVGVPDLDRDCRQSIVAGIRAGRNGTLFRALLTRKIRLKGSPDCCLPLASAFRPDRAWEW